MGGRTDAASTERMAAELKEDAGEIARTLVDRYRSIGETEGWLSLPPGLDQDHLPELIVALVAASLESGFGDGACRELVRIAALHGAHRREDGLDEHLVFTEFHLLRRALWDVLEDRFGGSSPIFDAAMELDMGIGLATSASIHGYHRQELEENGRWPVVLDELLEAWPGRGSR